MCHGSLLVKLGEGPFYHEESGEATWGWPEMSMESGATRNLGAGVRSLPAWVAVRPGPVNERGVDLEPRPV
ncbi:MAG: hypothetical protein OZSIB_3782 [Candidatus Ozemobacter sibiricus]|uniref:Uncharacterized protein n=1 Tax=Candidatus Ozemobacter sibiricus TaxID=2268124 RepID=A0A367ZP86_9BACT|nr:MAG: hypothetical protein OZSIB_3782 [Candidatus Ozemobacter sibiricus]